MVLGDEGTRRQYLFDLEQLGRLVALAGRERFGEREMPPCLLPPLPY